MDLKKSPIRRTKRQAKALEDNYWDCSVCTFRNTPEAFKCLMCDVRKGTSTRKPRINPLLAAQQVATQFLPSASSSSSSSQHSSIHAPAPKHRSPVGDKKGVAATNNHHHGVAATASVAGTSSGGKRSASVSSSPTPSPSPTPSTEYKRRRFPPRLRNIDRSTGQSRQVTVNQLTVTITEYQPKKKKKQHRAAVIASSPSSTETHSESSMDAVPASR